MNGIWLREVEVGCLRSCSTQTSAYAVRIVSTALFSHTVMGRVNLARIKFHIFERSIASLKKGSQILTRTRQD